MAYNAWADINIHGPWERTRVVSYYLAAPYVSNLNKWEDVFPLAIDSIRSNGKRRPETKSIVREMNEEEKQIYKSLYPNG